MDKRQKNNIEMKKIWSVIGLIAFFAIACKVYYELKWYDLLLGISKLQSEKRDIVLISQKTLMFVSKGQNAEQALVKVMSKNGWNYVDKFGMGYIFSSGDEELLLKRRDFGFGYVVFEIYPREEYRGKFQV